MRRLDQEHVVLPRVSFDNLNSIILPFPRVNMSLAAGLFAISFLTALSTYRRNRSILQEARKLARTEPATVDVVDVGNDGPQGP